MAATTETPRLKPVVRVTVPSVRHPIAPQQQTYHMLQIGDEVFKVTQ